MQGGISMEYVENPYKVQNVFAAIDQYKLRSLEKFLEGVYHGRTYQ
jgi:hypothetical protein